VHSVKLSECKVLKQAESGSNQAVGSILKGLGMKNEPKYPTPSEFIKGIDGGEGQVEQQPSVSLLGGGALDGAMSTNLLQTLSQQQGAGAVSSAVQLGPGIVVPPSAPGNAEDMPSNWGRCLEVMIASEFTGAVEPDAAGVYKLEIGETAAGIDVYFIVLDGLKKVVSKDVNPSGREPDVSVCVASSDLAAVLDGSLAPLQVFANKV